MLVHELIEQGAGEQTAFFTKQTKVSYRQSEKLAAKYRDFFYQQGVRPGDNVGLFSKNSIEFVLSYMAIASMGAVVVPLNFQLVPREIAYIVKDAEIKTLVTMSRLAIEGELEACGYERKVNQLVIPEFSGTLESMDLEQAPRASVSEDDVCVIIYTSGTTGNPKGALLTHRNLVSNARSFTELLPVSKDDNVLCVLPMYHCFAWTCAVLGSLLRGATITINDAFSRETAATIGSAKVTVVYAVPPMYGMFNKWDVAEELKTVKYFISGGASLPEQVAEEFYQKYNKRIIEGYGLSEASPVVCLNPLEKPKNCSIGKPLPEVEVRIVDAEGRDLPDGEIGELIVRGPNVMKGYYNLPEETAKALRDGWLHTGDMACRDSEGYFYIKDRLKDMIISNGENIYPREIEELLYAHPSVAEAAVVGVPDKLRGQAACAYIVVKDGFVFDKKALREYLTANLAAYKVPKTFQKVDVLPKNGTGKILKTVLREEARKAFEREAVS